MSVQGHAAGSTDRGQITPQNLIAGEYPRVSRVVTVVGADLPIGTVLGKITADQKFTISQTAASDGSQIPDAILGQDLDQGLPEQQAMVYFTGEFNEFALNIGAGHSFDSIRDAFRTKGVFFRQNQPI